MVLQHNKVYTAGTSFNKTDILDKSIKIIKTSRGGKITCHNPGQLVCYMVINLNRRKKDIRKFIISLENSIIETFKRGILKLLQIAIEKTLVYGLITKMRTKKLLLLELKSVNGLHIMGFQ